MNFRRLFVLVEGEDDERFFETVIKSVFEREYSLVQFWQYSQKKKEKINSYLNSIRSMKVAGMADFIVVADKDESPCVTDRKERILSSFRSLSAGTGGSSELSTSTRILIVCREIESWYLAGLNDEECKRLGLTTTIANTDRISKEQFLDLMPDRFDSKSEFMLEILRVFDHETARSKNSSFRYFILNYGTDQQ